jgi:uncharacterized protein YjiS (DUF1127 family)
MDTIDTISRSGTDNVGRGRPAYISKLVIVVTSIVVRLERRLEKRRSRLALLELTDDQLKDIGISRADAHREGLRSFLD